MEDVEMGQEAQFPTQVDSNNLAEHVLHNIEVDTPCNLFLLSELGERTLVAYGIIIPSKVGDLVHHQALESGQVKINVDSVLDGYRRWIVPFPPSDGTEQLGQLMGYYLRWPASNVELYEKDTTPTKPPHKANTKASSAISEKDTTPTKPPHKANTKASSAISENGREPLLADIYLQRLCKQSNLLYNVLMAQPPDETVFDVAFSEFNHEGIIKVNLVDILKVLKKDWVNVSILKIFCMLAADVCKTVGFTNNLFMDPEKCVAQNTEVAFDGMSRYITDFLLGVKDASSLIYLPYLQGKHWVLLVIQMSGPTVYVVDSLNPEGSLKLDIKTALDTALRYYWMHQNKNKRGTRFNWVKIESPNQPDETLCGYYVMRSMVNIVNEFGASRNLPSVISPGPQHYSDSQIDEVREMFSEYMRRVI